MEIPGPDPADFDPERLAEEDLIRSEFESIVSGLSLDESAPTTYLDELDRIDSDGFRPPNPARHVKPGFFHLAKTAIKRWLNRGDHDDDGVML